MLRPITVKLSTLHLVFVIWMINGDAAIKFIKCRNVRNFRSFWPRLYTADLFIAYFWKYWPINVGYHAGTRYLDRLNSTPFDMQTNWTQHFETAMEMRNKSSVQNAPNFFNVLHGRGIPARVPRCWLATWSETVIMTPPTRGSQTKVDTFYLHSLESHSPVGRCRVLCALQLD